ncbi:TusE/DsrC/DsvC family sulfur relay protein [Psittacicella gerlachiana]|uniref:Sulfurtransferase n=1 Tax=Psittacicella gerlachiana TaxID=2028574 RepID=A0A3A1Y169_9GAMM|nr:TusE/DsrC/DsvC family sulfur relay protein [Psittacicella gerlachiana]RIY31325.1 sulfurtransferase TusE [Psittacicella gerlachiana]
MVKEYQELETDAEGYLLDLHQWNEEIAKQIAKVEGIELTESHWLIINFVRSYFEKFETTPSIRLLVKNLEKEYGSEIGNSRYLQKMFNASPAKTVAKLAGLPKPAKCL